MADKEEWWQDTAEDKKSDDDYGFSPRTVESNEKKTKEIIGMKKDKPSM
ncbi:hypothetical protein MOE00_08210 [Bacillus inaquosorum]|nr:hypothetical protein [Bacillus inaquosorum]MCY8792298.1 hypothetical protein [Bacillus inaquosorum]